jgi:hypothetical protein
MLESLKKVLKGVTIIPHTIPKYHEDNSPLGVSCLCLCEYFSFVVSSS